MLQSQSLILDRLVARFFLLYLAELIIAGPVGFLIWGIHIRFILIIILIGLSLLSFFSVKISIKEFSVLVLFSTIFFMWSILIPSLRSIDIIDGISEGRALFAMFLIIPISNAFRYYGQDFIFNFSSYLVGIVAIAVSTCWISAVYFNNYLPAELLFNYLDTGIGGGIFIGGLADGSYRVTFIACMFFPFVIFAKKNSRFFIGWAVLMTIASVSTGTRAFLIGTIFAIVITVWVDRKKYIKNLIFYILVIIVFLSCLVYYDEFGGSRVLTFTDEFSSDSPRQTQFFSLMELWENNLFFGAGFGSVASEIRGGYSYELTYVALLAKTGIIGIGLLCVLLIKLFTNIPAGTARFNAFMILLLFLFITSTNPYLINLFGITLAAFFVTLAWNLKTDLNKRSHGTISAHIGNTSYQADG